MAETFHSSGLAVKVLSGNVDSVNGSVGVMIATRFITPAYFLTNYLILLTWV